MRLLSQIIAILKNAPIIKGARARRHHRHFLSESGFGSYYGLYESFQQACASLPESEGYDQEHLAEEFIPRMDSLFAYDYPVLFWLDRAFSSNARSVFDIGGAVGVHFYAYQKLLTYPDGTTWQVCETPAMARVGRGIAESRGDKRLTFADVLSTREVNFDVWLSAGALQYIENGYPGELLGPCKARPAHVIFSKLPVIEGEGFVTSQNIGTNSYSPFHVFGRARFMDEMESLGYRLIDTWPVPERSLYLPGHPEKRLKSFSGMYFQLMA
jgi:putative methyltransferase (TIGR04325 family)